MKEVDLIASYKGSNLDYTFPDIVENFIKATEFKNYNITEFFKMGLACAMYDIHRKVDGTTLDSKVVPLFIPKELENSVFRIFWSNLFNKNDTNYLGFDVLSAFVMELKNERLCDVYRSGVMFYNELCKYMIIPLWDDVGIYIANLVFKARFREDNISKKEMEFFLQYLKQIPIIVCNDGDKGKRHFIKEVEDLYKEGKFNFITKELTLDYFQVYFNVFNIH